MTQVLADVRSSFPMLQQKMHGKPLIYLDTAATALKPSCVIDTIRKYYSEQYGTVHRAVYPLAMETTERFDGVRRQVQAFLHAKEAEEIIFTKGATEAINLVATSYGRTFIQEGDEILISAIAHHANIVPWQQLCREKGATLRVIPVNDAGELDLEALQTLLSDKTKIVAIGHISNAIGTCHPVKKIVEMAHSVQAKVLVDGAQAAPHLPIDVQDLDVDFYVFSGHKVYGPTGVGVLYGKKDLLEAMPPYQLGGDMIEKVTFEKTTFQKAPLKFEAGTPMIAEVLGLGAALQFLTEMGLEKIHAQEQHLLKQAIEALSAIDGLQMIGTAKEKGSLVSIHVEGAHPLDIGTLLAFQGIAVRTGHLCSQPTMHRFGVEHLVRFSFGLYTTEEEIEKATETLKQVLKQLRG